MCRPSCAALTRSTPRTCGVRLESPFGRRRSRQRRHDRSLFFVCSSEARARCSLLFGRAKNTRTTFPPVCTIESQRFSPCECETIACLYASPPTCGACVLLPLVVGVPVTKQCENVRVCFCWCVRCVYYNIHRILYLHTAQAQATHRRVASGFVRMLEPHRHDARAV